MFKLIFHLKLKENLTTNKNIYTRLYQLPACQQVNWYGVSIWYHIPQYTTHMFRMSVYVTKAATLCTSWYKLAFKIHDYCNSSKENIRRNSPACCIIQVYHLKFRKHFSQIKGKQPTKRIIQTNNTRPSSCFLHTNDLPKYIYSVLY